MYLELSGNEREDRAVVIAVGRADNTPSSSRVQIVFLHQPPHLLRIHDDPTVTELGIDAAIAIALELVGDGTDLRNDRLVGGLARRLGIAAGSRDRRLMRWKRSCPPVC
jgi:hypothetical protein